MTSICLIRHGETDWNAQGKIQGMTDIPLNKTGILQAEACRDFIQIDRWDAIVTSPLKRAKKTAEIINERLKLPIAEMDEFKERHFGDAEGMAFEERKLAYPDKEYPNQENSEAFNSRVLDGIQKINGQYAGSRILLVAHGAVINAILTALSNGEIGSRQAQLMNACMSNIHFVQESWEIENYNQTGHLFPMHSQTDS